MEANEINKLKELWFAGEIELLKVLMEGAGLKYLHLDLYKLLIEGPPSGMKLIHLSAESQIHSVNNKNEFSLFTESVYCFMWEKLKRYKLEIDYHGGGYDLGQWEVKYENINNNTLYQPPLEIINKIIFELPLDYQPTEIEML